MNGEYRGQRVDNGKWVYGYYYKSPRGTYILKGLYEPKDILTPAEVHPSSVNQWTGELDINKEKIFNHGWVKASIYHDEEPQVLKVQFRKGAYIIDYEDSESDCVVIGEFVGSLEVIDDPRH